MGLKQTLSFKYKSSGDVDKFLQKIAQVYSMERSKAGGYVFSDDANSFDCLLAIEEYGLYSDRNRNYREFFGFLIEELTGVFGKVSIEDH